MTYVIRIEGEPVGKGRPRFTRRGSTYTPERTKEYGKKIAAQWKDKYGDSVLTGAVAVVVSAVYGIPKSDSKRMRQAKIDGIIPCLKKPDADNVLKEIMDYVPWETSDQQAVNVFVVKTWGEEPHVVATFKEMER